jgi:hypothetical protein
VLSPPTAVVLLVPENSVSVREDAKNSRNLCNVLVDLYHSSGMVRINIIGPPNGGIVKKARTGLVGSEKRLLIFQQLRRLPAYLITGSPWSTLDSSLFYIGRSYHL